jgi:hypothetical protein
MITGAARYNCDGSPLIFLSPTLEGGVKKATFAGVNLAFERIEMLASIDQDLVKFHNQIDQV